MGELPQPDVLVEQQFVEPVPTLIPPALPVVIIGVNNQIEFRQSAGAYDATSTVFSYPNLISGSVVNTASVKVHLFSTLGVFLLLPADLTIAAGDVTVGANAEVAKTVVDSSKTGKTSATTTQNKTPPYALDGVTIASSGTFTSAGSTFIADGVVPGMTLKIVDTVDAGDFEILSVDSENALTVKLKPWFGFTGFTGATVITFLIPQDSTIFTDDSTDFFKAGVVPSETVLTLESGTDIFSTTSKRSLVVDKIIDANNLQLDARVANGTGGAVTGAPTPTFTDTGADFVNDGVKVGDLLVLELGLNTTTHTIVTVAATTLTVTPDIGTDETAIEYHVSAVLAGESNLQYSLVRTTFEETGTILITYDAVRNDNIGKLVQVQSTTDIQNKLGPAIPENPLAFGVFLAGLNTATTLFATAVAADTIAEFTKATEFLETEDVFALVPLTQDPATAQVFSAHVTQQSSVDSKHERIVFINRQLFIQTTRSSEDPADTGALITNNTSPTLDTFADGTADFVTDGVIQGDEIEFTHTTSGVDTTETTRVFSRDSATALTLVDGLTAGFITAWNVAVALGNAKYNIKSAALDKFEQAEFIADFSKSFANRRVHNVWPDLVEITFSDSTQETTFLTDDELAGINAPQTGNFTEVQPAFFLGSMIGGMVPGNDPEQPFTNFNIVGAVGLRNSNRFFTNTQLDIIAAGGTYIVVQDVVDGPVFSRHQLSTDVSQIEKRELSITKVVDFTAKFFRNNLRPYIGKFNITQIYLEQVRAVADGILTRLVEDGTLIDGNIVKLEQSKTQPDTVILDVDILVPFPANFIRVTLLI